MEPADGGQLDPEAIGLAAARHRSLLAGCITVSGVPILASSAWQLVFGLYGYLLPLALFVARISLAIWDLARRDDLSRPATVAWIVAVLAVPFAGGPLADLFADLPRRTPDPRRPPCGIRSGTVLCGS